MKRIAAPDGKRGLAVEPWARGEIYAVAANWAEASDPVLVYGEDGWTQDEHGRQVADFRHNDRAALESVIREAIEMGGDEPDDDEVEAILDDAVDIRDGRWADMVEALDRHGGRFTGGDAEEAAEEWLGHGFTAAEADQWCEIGCWDADTAAEFRGAGLTPEQAREAADGLTEGLEDPREEYTDGDPVYSCCNGDTSPAEIIAAAREAAE